MSKQNSPFLYLKKLLLVALIILISSCVDEHKIVLGNFNTLVKATHEKNGNEFLSLLDQKTLKYFTEIFDLAKEYNEANISAHFNKNLATQVIYNIILIYIKKIPNSSENRMDYKDFIIFAVNNGFFAPIDSTLPYNVTIEQVNNQTFTVSCPKTITGRAPSLIQYKWVKEKDGWKINLMNHIISSDKNMHQFITRSGQTREGIIRPYDPDPNLFAILGNFRFTS